MSTKNSNQTFRLGITMAGAVSAGAYTAGFMDYLFETLNLWEAKKAENKKLGKDNPKYDKRIPMHDVVIEVLGGASAGAMTCMISALSLYSDLKPVKQPTNKKTGNILYDTWVLLDDEISDKNGLTTLEKMLDTSDIENNNDIVSLLNSESINSIANKAFENLPPKSEVKPFPKYISKDLRVLTTLCSIRPVPIEASFGQMPSNVEKYKTGHRMHDHMVVAHFKLKYDEESDKDLFLRFDPHEESYAKLMKLCTLGTGAFPLGLKMRHFEGVLSNEYIKNCILQNFGIKDSVEAKFTFKNNFFKGDYFDFTCIDGGAINNEPYSQVAEILEKYTNDTPTKPIAGTIMIDPFPNFYQPNPNEKKNKDENKSPFQKNIWQVLKKLYPLFQDQTRVKRENLLFSDRYRMLVFPNKKKNNNIPRTHPPCASTSLAGFGGFLDIKFRQHDFFLGRDNARNFLRRIFMLEHSEESPHPLFKDLEKEAIATFQRKIFIPIIPDLSLIDENEPKHNPYRYTVQEFPTFDPLILVKLQPKIKKRIKIITKIILNQITTQLKIKSIFATPLLFFIKKITSGKLEKELNIAIIKQLNNHTLINDETIKELKNHGLINDKIIEELKNS